GNADPLLGQSFLKKLPTWTMDNARHALVFGSDTPPQTATAEVQSPQPHREPPVATMSPLVAPEPRLTVAEIMKRANAARYGIDGSKDYAQAMQWFRKAASQ